METIDKELINRGINSKTLIISNGNKNIYKTDNPKFGYLFKISEGFLNN